MHHDTQRCELNSYGSIQLHMAAVESTSSTAAVTCTPTMLPMCMYNDCEVCTNATTQARYISYTAAHNTINGVSTAHTPETGAWY
jgi:uncharacterized Zn-binding protein involved in type VI secretion